MKPLVSICCTAYNHEKYIRDAIDGFLSQKTDFVFEILIHDDASTDQTATIIREYVDNYPGLIRAIYQTENQYSKGKKVMLECVVPNANGIYVAMCEGDDYWTDPYKIQKQVNIITASSEYVVVCHEADLEYNDAIVRFNDYYSYKLYGLYELLGDMQIHTMSVLFKKEIVDKISYNYIKRATGAYFFFVAATRFGKIYKIGSPMGVYRIHEAGIWNGKSKVNQAKMALQNIMLMADYYSFDENACSVIKNKYAVMSISYSVPVLMTFDLKGFFDLNLGAVKEVGLIGYIKAFSLYVRDKIKYKVLTFLCVV